MKISTYDGSKLRMILIGMITDSKVCSRICTEMAKKGGPRFRIKYADIIAGWCRRHLEDYGEPPGALIEDIFNDWAATTRSDDKVIEQIANILDYLSEQHEITDSNADFILDSASQYFNETRLKEVAEDLDDRLEDGDWEEAYQIVEGTTRVELGYTTVMRPLEDHTVWSELLDEERVTPIFEYPGALGDLVGDSFVRGTLYAFMGVDKAGKSFYLQDAVWRAIKRRHKVAYFEVGDLGKEEVIRRLGQRILRQPLTEQRVDWPTGQWEEEDPEEPVRKKVRKDGLSVASALKLARRYTRGHHLLKLSCHPNSSINVNGIEGYLQDWAREEMWLPDMVVIDYADILAPPSGFQDTKDQIDETWKALRRMSQKFNCLVLTATQTGAQAYRKKATSLGRGDFSGRKTKNAHVNGMLGINATPEDRQHCVTRVNWVVRRSGAESGQVLVAGCPAVAMPIVYSRKAPFKHVENSSPLNGSEDSKPNGKPQDNDDSEWD